MRHRVAHRKLGRVSEHRLALLRNQAEALLRHERIRTTVPKAKELRPFVERLITIAKRGIAAGDNGPTLQARRLVLRDIPNRTVVGKLFETIAPRFAERPGGYTRLLRIGFRRGDNAALAQVELVGSEYAARPSAEKTAPAEDTPKAKGVGGRLRAAAQRMRRPKKDAPAGSSSEEAKPPRQTRRKKKTSDDE